MLCLSLSLAQVYSQLNTFFSTRHVEEATLCLSLPLPLVYSWFKVGNKLEAEESQGMASHPWCVLY